MNSTRYIWSIILALTLLFAPSAAQACRGPMLETYVFTTESPPNVPAGAVTLAVDVDPAALKKYNAPLLAHVREGPAGAAEVRIGVSAWTSCTWWAAETRLFYAGKRGGPYFVTGYLYRAAGGETWIDPVQYGPTRTQDPGRFGTTGDYLKRVPGMPGT